MKDSQPLPASLGVPPPNPTKSFSVKALYRQLNSRLNQTRLAQSPQATLGYHNSKHTTTNMTREEILDKLKTLIDAQLNCGEDAVTEDASFSQDLGSDSLDHVELIMALEEEFAIDIPDEAAEKIETVSDVIDYISSEIA